MCIADDEFDLFILIHEKTIAGAPLPQMLMT